MKRVACAVLLAACTATPALAIPGQTETQIFTWGKDNREFTQFERAHDSSPKGPGYEYLGKLKVDGYDTEFHAKLNLDGTIKYEVLVFLNLATPPAQNVNLFRDAIANVYGGTYERDFISALHLPNTGDVAMWRGALLGYSGFGNALLIFSPQDFDAILKQSHCDVSGCSPTP
ncbi:MAG: hypothetical protein JO322_08750 [Candidatus Eremiobacteraeota bacterium]|nr:hypothetical protein [Candidatus Eremiobacteraeota bacterium]